MMSKTKQQVLESFMRRNKGARETMAHNAGFDNSSKFQAHLNRGITRDKKAVAKKIEEMPKLISEEDASPVKGKITIHNVHILDKSGSMSGGKIVNAIKGINGEIAELKLDDESDYLQTIVSFSGRNQIDNDYYRTPIDEVSEYNSRTYGMTALNQAIVITLRKIMKDRVEGEKTIVKVFTDGGENHSSREYGTSIVSETIKEAELVDITIAFVGTKYDVKYAVENYNVHASNTLIHDNTQRGVKMSFMATIDSTKSYSKNVRSGKSVKTGFFKTTKTK